MGEVVTLPLSRRSLLSRMAIARYQLSRTHEERMRYLREL